MKYQSPVDKSWVTDGHTDGSATDLGHWKKDKNPNQDVFSVGNGEVLWTGYMNNLGNGIVTKHPYNSTHDMWVGMGHFLKLPIVKKGDKVKQGQKIANMGKSGISRGEHVHVRMSLVPKNTRFSWANFNKEPRLDPVDYLYEYPHQFVEGLQKLPTDKPKPPVQKPSKPKTEYVTVSGKHNLYINSTGSDKYGVPMQNLAKRDMKVLARANGRVKVDTSKISAFDVNSFWLDLGDKKPTPKPQPAKPKVEYASVGGRHTLYKASTGTGHYGKANQNLAHRRMPVLARANGRVKVDASKFYKANGKRVFDVDSFWVKL